MYNNGNSSVEEYYRLQDRQGEIHYRQMQQMQQSQMGQMAAMQALSGWPSQQSTQPVERKTNKKLLLLTNKV